MTGSELTSSLAIRRAACTTLSLLSIERGTAVIAWLTVAFAIHSSFVASPWTSRRRAWRNAGAPGPFRDCGGRALLLSETPDSPGEPANSYQGVRDRGRSSRAPLRPPAPVRRLAAYGEPRRVGEGHAEEAPARDRRRCRSQPRADARAPSHGDSLTRADQGRARRRAPRRPGDGPADRRLHPPAPRRLRRARRGAPAGRAGRARTSLSRTTRSRRGERRPASTPAIRADG